MAEGFNLEEISKKFNALAEGIDAIKTQNALNIGDTSRVLSNLGVKLDELANSLEPSEDNTKDLLDEIKHTLEDRYSFINVKFTELESSFKNVLKNNEELVTTPKMKELFDVLSTNLTVFSKQVMAQGDILNEITLRIEALRTDDTDKRDIIKNIGLLKNDLDKFNNGFESIILNVNNNYETLMEHISHLDPTSEVENMKNAVSDMKMTTDTIMSAVQVVDQKQNNLNDTMSEIISQNTKINANVKALAGQSDFDGLVRKVEGAIELITTLKSALTDANEQSQKALLVQLDKLSSTVTRILTEEDFEIFKSELSKLVYDVIESTNVMRGDLISTTSEFKDLAKMLEDLDLKTSFSSLRTLIDDSTRNIKESVVDAVANSGIEPIKNNLNLLVEKLDQTKTSIVESGDRNSERTSEKLDSIFELADKVREMVTYMPDTIKQNYMSVEEGQRAFVEKSVKDLETISDGIKYLQSDLKAMSTPFRETLMGDIKQLKEIVFDIKNYVSASDEVIAKVTNLETILGRVAGDYDVALHSVQDNIIQYMSGIKEDCESADIKMNNFAFEFNSLKSELGKVFADYKNATVGQNEKFNSVCNGISSRFDNVMTALATISEQPAAIAGIKEGFESVQRCMQDLLLEVSDLKVGATANRINTESAQITAGADVPSSDALLKLEDKLNKLKDQLNFMSTDMMENLYNRTETILKEFEPVQKAVLSFVDVDLQNVASVLKEQMDAYKIGMEQIVQEIPSDEARSVLNNLFTGFGSLENKIAQMETSIKDAQAKSIEEIKNLLEQAKSLMPSVAEMNSERAVVSADVNFDELIEKLDAKLVEVQSGINDKFSNVHKHLDDVVIPKLDNINNKQNDLFAKIDSVKSTEELNAIKNQLNELFDKLSNVQDDITNNKIAANAVTPERLEGLGDEEKSIIVDFTNNLSELANLVKHSSDNIDAKITRALSENAVNVDFEGLKADIAQMLSAVQSQVSDIAVEDNNGTNGAPVSLVKVLLEEYKSQIVDAVNSVKQTVWDYGHDEEVAKDIKVISQKIDLLALNDDVKFEIDKSLQEIKSIVKDQQKFLNTINILETLASLEDINKMKGLEQLSKLNEIISVDKLNALNKLTLLDKLKNLDCLDELQKIPKLSGMLEVQEQLKTVINGLDQKLNVFSKNYSTLDIFTEDVKNEFDAFKNELNTAKTAIMKHVLNVFEQLSFVVEGEEIKDFVDEKAQVILDAVKNNETLNQEVKTIKSAVDAINPLEYKDIEGDMKRVNEVADIIENFPQDVENKLSEKFKEFKQQLNLMRVGTTEDDENYTYALQDVESDIARLRLALDDIKKVVEENSLKEIAEYVNEIVKQVDDMKFNISQDDIFKMKVDIERITSDIVSISSRTNKLLLASDESAQALNTSMQSFRNTISDLYDGLKKLDYSEMTAKLEEVNNQIVESNKQQRNITDTVARLAVWSESTDETLADVNDTLTKLKKAMPSSEAVLEELEVKFAKQQQKIDALEDKLDELLAANEDSDTSNMSKKLTDIDKQLTKLNRSIERLTSYVDEE